MSSSQGLYSQLFVFLRAVHSEPHVTRIQNWVWIMVGMIQSHSVHLSQIAQYIPSEAQAAGRIAQIRRWLSNRFVDPIAFYRPLVKQVLIHWANQHLFVILDSTAVNKGRLQVLRLSLSHACRALPLSWLVLNGTGLPTVEDAAPLFSEARALLKAARRITFIGDRGFRDVDWARQCRKLRWNYLIRIANNTYVYLPDGQWLSIAQLGVKPGQRRYFSDVALTRAHAFRCNLMITWTEATVKQPAELCAVISNLRPNAAHLQQYLKRMHIEESFRDDKSGSCDLAKSHLRDAERLNHLLLASAVVTLWVHQIGQELWLKKQRKEIDPAAERQLSIFQIGWRKLLRAASQGLVPPLTLRIRPMRLLPGIFRRKSALC